MVSRGKVRPPVKRVVISGYYGFGNLGDEALLRAIISGLRRRVDNLEIIVPSGDPERTARAHSVRSIPRTNPFLWWSLLGDCHLFISGGGSLLQDVTGPWNIPYYAGLMLMAEARRVPVMIFGQGVGPIRGYWGRQLTRRVVQRAAAVTVRDPGSRQFLLDLGVRREITLVADPVFSLQFEDLPAKTTSSPLRIGIALRRQGMTEQLVARLAVALDELAEKKAVEYVFFPMQPQEDVPAAGQVARRLRCDHQVVTDSLGLDATAQLIAGCDLVVAMRLHALILSALVGTPFVGISYDPKVAEFLRQVDGVSLANLPQVPPKDSLLAALVNAVEARGALKERLTKHLPTLRSQAEKAADIAADLLYSL